MVHCYNTIIYASYKLETPIQSLMNNDVIRYMCYLSSENCIHEHCHVITELRMHVSIKIIAIIMNEWLLNLFQVLYILKMVQVVLVLGILLSMIQIDLAIPASGKLGYHIISAIPSPDAPCNETELQCLTLSLRL